MKENGLHIIEDDLLMFVRAAPPHLVEEVGKILCRLICGLSSSATLDFIGGKFSVVCNCCNSQDGKTSLLIILTGEILMIRRNLVMDLFVKQIKYLEY